MNKLNVEKLDVSGKRVLVRVDFNVPLAGGRVADDTRIRAALPTIRNLRDRGASIVLMSHLGRPKGVRDPKLSLAPAATRLAELLGVRVSMASDCVGPEVESMAAALAPGDVLLLENLRFHAGETKNDPGFADQLAKLGEAYVNDAFGTAHRAHASTVGVAERLAPAASGLLLQRELDVLGELLGVPKKPFIAILGGAKISGKIDVIQSLLPRVDRLLVGGGMMYTFLKAQGLGIGLSLCEDERVDMARDLIAMAGDKLLLPVDTRVLRSLDDAGPAGDASTAGDAADGHAKPAVVPCDHIPADHLGVDIGPKTIEAFTRALDGAGTVFWNGPLGIFERPSCAGGTMAIARAVGEVTRAGATTVIGGGDSVAAINASGMASTVSHLSTGGGATLEFIEGKELPGVAVLADETSVEA